MTHCKTVDVESRKQQIRIYPGRVAGLFVLIMLGYTLYSGDYTILVVWIGKHNPFVSLSLALSQLVMGERGRGIYEIELQGST